MNLCRFTTIVKLSKSFTLTINKISLKRKKKNRRLCTSSISAMDLIEKEGMR